MGGDKLWVDVCGRPLIAWTLDAVTRIPALDVIVVVSPSSGWDQLRALHTGSSALHLVAGGARRQDSVRAGVEVCTQMACDVIAVHDAARPLVLPTLCATVLAAAAQYGAATAAIPVVDSIKRVDADGRVLETLDRAALVAVQTPQAFRHDVLADAHRHATAQGITADDDCALVEAMGGHVHVVPGDPRNFKVTTPLTDFFISF